MRKFNYCLLLLLTCVTARAAEVAPAAPVNLDELLKQVMADAAHKQLAGDPALGSMTMSADQLDGAEAEAQPVPDAATMVMPASKPVVAGNGAPMVFTVPAVVPTKPANAVSDALVALPAMTKAEFEAAVKKIVAQELEVLQDQQEQDLEQEDKSSRRYGHKRYRQREGFWSPRLVTIMGMLAAVGAVWGGVAWWPVSAGAPGSAGVAGSAGATGKP